VKKGIVKSMRSSIPVRFRKHGCYLGYVLALAVFAAGMAFAATQEAGLSQYSPHKAVAGFFDKLLGAGPRQAAELAVFPNEEARARFIREWTSSRSSLAGYKIEGWDVEPTKGSAEVALTFRNPEHNRTLEVGLVKVDGAWKVSPEKASGPAPAVPSAPVAGAELEKLLDITSDRRGNQIELYVVNKAPFSVLLWFDMDLPALLKPDRPLPLHGIVPPSQASLPLCVLQVVGDSAYRYSWRYSVKRADDAGEIVGHAAITTFPTVAVPDEYRFSLDGKYGYGLPFPADQAYLIWQGPGGAFSHNTPGSKHAVDFSMPLGSEVAAVRDGIVVGVIQKNPNNPDDKPAPKEMANEILVLHADGTIAVYAHLTTDGARVSFGQFVGRGHAIGLSGNSGYSRGPHLHFDILGYEDGQCVSMPYGFLSSEGTFIQPAKELILLAEKDGTCRTTQKETTPWRIVGRYYEEYNTEIRYYAKSIEFLASNKTAQPLPTEAENGAAAGDLAAFRTGSVRDNGQVIGLELSFSRLDNVAPMEKMPRRAAIPPDGAFHTVATLELVNPGEKSSFSYQFRRVEPPGMEHIPLRVEKDGATGYEVEIRYFSDRIELYAVNTSSREMVGALSFSSLTNLVPKEKVPTKIQLAVKTSPQYLATLRIRDPANGYSFRYNVGPWEGQ
jgi:murein DD-endopeptidase MepM/ murein hydrolase activator NlpD